MGKKAAAGLRTGRVSGLAAVGDGDEADRGGKGMKNPYSYSRYRLELLLEKAEEEGLFRLFRMIEENDSNGSLEKMHMEMFKRAFQALREREEEYAAEYPESIKGF